MLVNKGHTFRSYLNKKQEKLLKRLIVVAIYNQILFLWNDTYKEIGFG